jgi:predicted P-loop ATPase
VHHHAADTVIWTPDLHLENDSPLYVAKLATALSEPFEAYPDACLMPYVCDPPRRLGIADTAAEDVRIRWIPIDLDSPAKARPELRGTAELEQWQATQVDLATTFDPPPLAIWESPSGGLRLLWAATPDSVTTRDYNPRCAAFLEQLRAHGLDGIDPTSAQWWRFQRVPRGKDVLWCEPTATGDLELPPLPPGATLAPLPSTTAPTSAATDTVLFRMFEAAEIPYLDVGRDDLIRVICPWDDEHSDAAAPGYDPLSGRAVIMADMRGLGMGVFRCQHAHCAHRSNAEVLEMLQEDPAAAAVLAAHDAAKNAVASALLETTEPIAPAVQAALDSKDPHSALADWKFRLQLKGKGQTVPSTHNLQVTFQWHPEWRGVFGFDELANEVVLLQDMPVEAPARLRAGSRFTADDYQVVLAWFERWLQIKPAAGELCDAIKVVAELRGSFHPVREYLRALSWDGQERDLCTYLGAEPTEYHRAAAHAWLRSAVARVMRPGCKADNVVILEGSQGCGKSTALRVLAAREDWYYEACGDVGDKDFAQDMRGKWIAEIPEIDRLIASKDEATLKALISKLVDRYRPSYGRASQDFPRQVVFGGTTNRDDYLRDVTGNRRYWPLVCGLIDIPALRRDIDQIWAQTVAEYDAGKIWWLEGDVQRTAVEQQADRVERDVWEDFIREWREGADARPFTTQEALGKLPGAKTAAELTQIDKNRMGRVLRTLGYVLRSSHRDGRNGHYWCSTGAASSADECSK